jgi:predicted Zn-ribbon and HTH transcriptional regulator
MEEIHLLIDTNHIYLMSEQPTTCKLCGARTNWLADFSHTNAKLIIHECRNKNCGFLFYEEDDNFNAS